MAEHCHCVIPSSLPCCPDDAVVLCGRPRGHRGDCGYSEQPDPPLRPVRFPDGSPAQTIERLDPHMFKIMAHHLDRPDVRELL